MTGYVRKDTTNNIADGNVINAADLDSEFDGVQAAFNSSTGHTHDGTASEGAPITKLGPVQDVTVSTTVLGVKTTNTVDLGTSSLKFKDFYLAGNASIGGTLTYGGVTLSNAVTGTGNMVLSASPTITGTITAAAANFSGAVALNGNTTIGDADTDTITQVASYVTGTQLKSAKTATNTLSLAAYDVDGTSYTNLITLTASNTPTLALTSTGVGTINNMSIGATTASTGAFTTLSASGAVTLSGGTINGVAYLNGTNVLTTGSALVFDGTNVDLGTVGAKLNFATTGSSTRNYIGGSADGYSLEMVMQRGASQPLSYKQNYSVGHEWGIAGSGAMTLTSTGLGIGTSSPAARLSVIAASANSTAATIGGIEYGGSKRGLTIKTFNSAGGDDCGVEFNAANGLAGYGAFKFAANTTTLATIDASGNLGLGVTPSANAGLRTLYVSGYNGGYSAIGLGASGGGYGCVGYNLGFTSTDGQIKALASDGMSWIRFQNGAFQFFQQTSATAGTTYTGTQAMTLDASGRLGITETSPTAKLHIGVASAAVDGTKGVRITNPAGTIVMLECGSGGDSFVGTTSGSDFNIRTNNITRATFDNAGNLLVGSSSTIGTGGKFQVTSSTDTSIFKCTSSTTYAAIVSNVENTNARLMAFQYGSGGSPTNVGAITTNGTGVTYGTSSDYRLKENIIPMTGALDKVAQLKPVTYKWKINGSDGQGFIAHELAEVVPDAVQGEKDAIDADGNPVYQGIDTSFLVATLTAAIQEQQALITQLQADVAALKGA